jgi:hypothetical protein
MNVGIDQPRANHEPADVPLRNLGRTAAPQISANARDLPVDHKHIRNRIQKIGWVDDMPTCEQERIHFERALYGGGLTRQAS